ncbi:unnamed protein product, partial [Amoebophrya sp. A25]
AKWLSTQVENCRYDKMTSSVRLAKITRESLEYEQTEYPLVKTPGDADDNAFIIPVVHDLSLRRKLFHHWQINKLLELVLRPQFNNIFGDGESVLLTERELDRQAELYAPGEESFDQAGRRRRRRGAAASESRWYSFLSGCSYFVGHLAGIFSDDWQAACNRGGDAFNNRSQWVLYQAERELQRERDIDREKKFLRKFAYPLSALHDLSQQLTWMLRSFPSLLGYFGVIGTGAEGEDELIGDD